MLYNLSMRILITGAGGFVGSALLKRLPGHDLILPSRDPSKFPRAGVGSFPLFTEDLAGLVASAAPEIVINLLGIIRETPGSGFTLVHEEYTRRLLAGARAAGVKKFIQMSALGAAPDSPSAYQRSKFAGEEAVRQSGLPYVIFRPSFITGPGQRLGEELKALARFTPLFAAPSDAWAAPLPAEVVAACFARAAEDASIRDEVFELGGDRVLNFRTIMVEALAAAGVRRPVLGLPRAAFRPLLPLFSLLPVPPMTREQYLMLSRPNVPSGAFRGVKDLLPG
ncbi:MAG TPA: complex I NDUFA9 subunit family protein [Elusimicrobia bacterium]|nr:complex I NDUFA9 subunit family protein [Elusimicrobiota bacterium]